MIQAISGLHRDLKDVVELSFVMVKLKSLGLSKGYRVEMYETAKQNSKTRIGTFVRKYKAEIFPLYRSYAGGTGSEATVDKRQNILGDKRLWVFAAAMVLCIVVAWFFVYRFFHPQPKTQPVAASTAGVSASAGALQPGNASQPVGGGSKALFSDTWRIVGGFSANRAVWVVLADQSGHLRVESPSNFQNYGIAQVGTIDGEHVSTFSGGRSSAMGVGVSK